MAGPAVIGLDIGSTSVRAAETRRGKAGSVITKFGQAPLPAGAVHSGTVQDDSAVTGALKQLWAATKFRSRNVVLGVTDRQAVVREMSVPNLPPKEMRQSLPFEVRHVLPLAVENSLIDFYLLEDPGRNKTVRGLLIATPKEPVLTAIRATERAGLHVARVDLASFALLRSTCRLDTRVEAIADIGAQATTVVVHADGTPLIVRIVPRGGAEITEKIAERLGVTAPEAETIKCENGLQAETDPATAAVIRDALRPLVNEIRSSFAYLTTGEAQTQVTRLVLAGGGALLPGLAQDLSIQLGVEVVVADPLLRLRDTRRGGRRQSPERLRPSAAVCIGLTLGAI